MAISQINHIKNDLIKMIEMVFWLLSNRVTFLSKFPIKKSWFVIMRDDYNKVQM